MSEINAIAISGTQPLDIENYFSINFNSLNDSINKLGDRSTELTDDDKKLAIEIIDTWNTNVIETLDTKISEVREFCDSFDMSYEGISLSDEEIEALARHLGFGKEYDDYNAAWTKFFELRKERDYIDEKYSNISCTAKNRELLGHYSAEKYQNKVELAKSRRNCNKITTDLFTKMSKTSEVKKFLKKGREFLSQASTLKKAAVDKANMARVNVAIDNINVRDALFDLIQFTF